MKKVKIAALTIGLPIALLVGVWALRFPLMRLFPIHHSGELARIAAFHKGGISRRSEGTRQLNQFALIFTDGFQCEGTDTSFAAIKPGDSIRIKAYHDVAGFPILNPEFWECDEAQLVALVQ
jgi:hypothetical protein